MRQKELRQQNTEIRDRLKDYRRAENSKKHLSVRQQIESEKSRLQKICSELESQLENLNLVKVV